MREKKRWVVVLNQHGGYERANQAKEKKEKKEKVVKEKPAKAAKAAAPKKATSTKAAAAKPKAAPAKKAEAKKAPAKKAAAPAKKATTTSRRDSAKKVCIPRVAGSVISVEKLMLCCRLLLAQLLQARQRRLLRQHPQRRLPPSQAHGLPRYAPLFYFISFGEIILIWDTVALGG